MYIYIMYNSILFLNVHLSNNPSSLPSVKQSYVKVRIYQKRLDY